MSGNLQSSLIPEDNKKCKPILLRLCVPEDGEYDWAQKAEGRISYSKLNLVMLTLGIMVSISFYICIFNLTASSATHVAAFLQMITLCFAFDEFRLFIIARGARIIENRLGTVQVILSSLYDLLAIFFIVVSDGGEPVIMYLTAAYLGFQIVLFVFYIIGWLSEPGFLKKGSVSTHVKVRIGSQSLPMLLSSAALMYGIYNYSDEQQNMIMSVLYISLINLRFTFVRFSTVFSFYSDQFLGCALEVHKPHRKGYHIIAWVRYYILFAIGWFSTTMCESMFKCGVTANKPYFYLIGGVLTCLAVLEFWLVLEFVNFYLMNAETDALNAKSKGSSIEVYKEIE